jgi:hypothetical protein
MHARHLQENCMDETGLDDAFFTVAEEVDSMAGMAVACGVLASSGADPLPAALLLFAYGVCKPLHRQLFVLHMVTCSAGYSAKQNCRQL